MICIITVTYNAEQFIRSTLESLLVQNFKNYELIIKDANSTDKTLEIIKEYSKIFEENQIKLKIVSKKDNSIYDGMNQALELIEHEWVYFLNAGDTLYSKETLNSIYTYLDENLDIIYGSVNMVLDNKVSKIKKPFKIQEILKGMIFCHQGVIIKSKLMKEEKYDTKYKVCADYNFFLKMYLAKKKFKEIDTIFSNYDLNGYSNKNSILTLKETFEIIKENKILTNNIKINFILLMIREKMKNIIQKIFGNKIYLIIRKINL
ncbi:MAG: glycosyltransferase family 2 protein [Fusobacteriaceae bacterium]